MYLGIYLCVYIYMYVSLCVCMYIYAGGTCVYLYTYVHIWLVGRILRPSNIYGRIMTWGCVTMYDLQGQASLTG